MWTTVSHARLFADCILSSRPLQFSSIGVLLQSHSRFHHYHDRPPNPCCSEILRHHPKPLINCIAMTVCPVEFLDSIPTINFTPPFQTKHVTCIRYCAATLCTPCHTVASSSVTIIPVASGAFVASLQRQFHHGSTMRRSSNLPRDIARWKRPHILELVLAFLFQCTLRGCLYHDLGHATNRSSGCGSNIPSWRFDTYQVCNYIARNAVSRKWDRCAVCSMTDEFLLLNLPQWSLSLVSITVSIFPHLH